MAKVNVADFKAKMDKLGSEFAGTGRRAIWLNHKDGPLPPELQRDARARGVTVYDGVFTGRRDARAGQVHIDDVLRAEHKRCLEFQRVRLASPISGGARSGLGLWLMYSTSADVREGISTVLAEDTRTRASVAHLGRSGTLFLSGAGSTVAGASRIAADFSPAARAARLMTISKWGGRAGVVLCLASEACMVWQYSSGGMSQREFYTAQAGLVGGVVAGAGGAWGGGVAGAAIGASVGSIIPGVGTAAGAAVGSVVGAVAGGFGGGYLGSSFATAGAAKWYGTLDAERQARADAFLYNLYGVAPP